MQWHPIPVDLIRRAERTRWSESCPASDLDGYAIIWRSMEISEVRPTRELAGDLGWSRWQARKMVERVKADRIRFYGSAQNPQASPQAPPKVPHSPPQVPHSPPVKSGTCGEDSAQSPPQPAQSPPSSAQTPPTAGADLQTTNKETPQDTTKKKTGIKSPSIAQEWGGINAVRSEHVPGSRALKLTESRKRALKLRLKDHGEGSAVKVWRWALTSNHPRASFLREGGHVTPDTLHRPKNFPGYLEAAEADEVKTQAAAAQSSELEDWLGVDP